MKIRLEKGMFLATILGVVCFGVSGWAVLTGTPPIFPAQVMGVILLMLAFLFAKIPFCTIVFHNDYFVVPYSSFIDKTWSGKQSLRTMWGTSFFFYRKKIPQDKVRYVVLCQYTDLPKVLAQISDDPQSVNKISAYAGAFLKTAPSTSSVIEKAAVASGIGQGIGSGNLAGGVLGGVAGAAMGSYVIADAARNNVIFGLRTSDQLILSTIGMERRRSDCKPFAEYLSTHGVRVIS